MTPTPKTGLPPSSDSEVPTERAATQPVDPSTFRIDHIPVACHQQPERSDKSHSIPVVKTSTKSLGTDNDVSIHPSATLRPGAIFVTGTSAVHEDGDAESPNVSGVPLEAHLAPDEADAEARLREQLTIQITKELEERMATTTTQEIDEHTRQRDDHIVMAAEVKAVSPHVGLKTHVKWGFALFLLLMVGGGLSYFFLERKDKDPISSGESTGDVGTVLDPLLVELRSLIAPTDEDLLPFLDTTSPQSRALAWLQQDKITLTYGRSMRTVLERYVLAVLYYSTMGPSWSLDSFNFLHSSDVCDWNDGIFDVTNYTSLLDLRWIGTKGVYCANDGESIDVLSLRENNLHGSIPWELVLLTNLAYINVQLNALSGSIPTRVNELKSLEFFVADQSRLTGTLPEIFSPLMQIISLSSNEFTGPIPDSWGATMPDLTEIILVGNMLTGSLPASIGRLSNLGNLIVNQNQLTGTLQSDLGELSSLWQLSLSGNMLTGTLPSSIGRLSNLALLFVDANQLTGTLPSVLAELTSLQQLFLSTNQLTGTLPASIGRLSNLVQLNVDNNQLTGTLPSDLGELSSLYQLLLSFNKLTGTVPASIGRLSNLSILDVTGNQLTGTLPSDLREMTSLHSAGFQENSFTGSIDESVCLLPYVLEVRVDCSTVNCSCCDCCTDEECP